MMQKYGLIGYPLKHSFSKDYFNEKFKAEHIDAIKPYFCIIILFFNICT